jgi:hypothetical protein
MSWKGEMHPAAAAVVAALQKMMTMMMMMEDPPPPSWRKRDSTFRHDFTIHPFPPARRVGPLESFSTQRDGGRPKEGNRESLQIERER